MRPPYKISWLITSLSLFSLISMSYHLNYSLTSLASNFLGYFTGKEYHPILFMLTAFPIYLLGVSVILTYYAFLPAKTTESGWKPSWKPHRKSIRDIKLETSLETRLETPLKTSLETDDKDSKPVLEIKQEKRINTSELKALERFNDLVDAKFYKEPDIMADELAKKLQIQRRHLSKIMRLAGFKSFTEMVNLLRIEESCKLLATDEFQAIKMVGYEVGYNTMKQFILQFQKHQGCTPYEYKMKNQKKQ